MSFIKFTPAKITFNAPAYEKAVSGIVQKHMSDFEERLIDTMCDEISMVDTKSYFKQVVGTSLKNISKDISGAVVTYTTGFDAGSAGEFDTIKAMVINNGMHAGWAGPNGRIVLDNYLDSRHPSRIEGEGFKLPPSWDHEGRPFVVNAFRKMNADFEGMLSDILSEVCAIPLAQYITISI